MQIGANKNFTCLLRLYCTYNNHPADMDRYGWCTMHTHTHTLMLKSLSSDNCHTHTHTWQLCQEAPSRSILLYSFICFVMKANLVKSDTCRNEHLFGPSVGDANEADEYSDRTHFRARVLGPAHSRWRESRGRRKGSKSPPPAHLPLLPSRCTRGIC